MSSFAVDGLVSGLDTANLISQLMQVERIPQQRLQVQANTYGGDIKAFQSLASVLKKLDTASTALADPATWTSLKATTDGTSLTATARAGAPVGTTAVTVDSLATAARWTVDTAHGMDEAVFGTDPITVTKADGTTASVSPASGTMREVMAAINNADGLGVRAVAVRVGPDSYRLQVVATETGTAAAPQSVSGLAPSGTGAVTTTDATDAVWRIGTIEGRSGSNSVTDLVSGLDVTLRSTGPTSISVTSDPAATRARIDGFVTAVNDALAEVKKQSAPGIGGAGRGPLASDSLVRGLTSRILQGVTGFVGSAGAASLGIQSTRDGTVTVDADALTAALAADPGQVRAVLAPAAGDGIASRMRAAVAAATDPGDGFITSAVQGRETSKRDLETQILSWDRRLELRQGNLQRQFSGLEVALGKLQSQSSWLSGQLAGLSRGYSA